MGPCVILCNSYNDEKVIGNFRGLKVGTLIFRIEQRTNNSISVTDLSCLSIRPNAERSNLIL